MIKNLDNIELWELGNTGSEASGKTWEQIKVTSNYRIRTKNLIKCPSTLNLYLSSDYHLDLLWFDENGLMISSPLASGWIKGLNGVRLDISVPSEAKLMGILIKKDNNGEITLSDIGYTNFYSFEDNESSIPSNVIISNNINTIFIGEILASKMYIGSSLIWTSLNLPDNCVEIEYLESDGNQWIDSGIFINQTDFEIGYEASGMGSWGWVHQNAAGGIWISFENATANNKCTWWYGNYNSHSLGNYQEGFYTVKYTLQGIDIGTYHLSYLGSLLGDVSNISLKFFSLYDFNVQGVSTGTRFITKFKSFYIKIGGTLVADFIPVRVGNIGYMYDRVSEQLFANQGTGNFILGPDK